LSATYPIPMKKQLYSLVLAGMVSLGTFTGCDSKKEDQPKPVTNQMLSNMRMTVDEIPMFSGSTNNGNGFTTINIIFPNGYSYSLVYGNDPTSGFPVYSVTSPGGTISVSDDYTDFTGSDCVNEAMAFYTNWAIALQTLGTDGNPCVVLNSYYDDLLDLLDCIPGSQQAQTDQVRAAIDLQRSLLGCN